VSDEDGDILNCVQANEDTTTHRPILYLTLDNLAEATAIDHYDGTFRTFRDIHIFRGGKEGRSSFQVVREVRFPINLGFARPTPAIKVLTNAQIGLDRSKGQYA
jgi:hypothetical protein